MQKIANSILLILFVAVMISPAAAWADAYTETAPVQSSGPFYDTGQFAGSLLLQSGEIVVCYATNQSLTCYLYGPEPEIVYGGQVGMWEAESILLQGCGQTAWVTVRGDGVTVFSFALPGTVAECNDPSRVFYPLVVK